MLYQYDFRDHHLMLLIYGVVAIILFILLLIFIVAKKHFVINKGSSDKITYNQFHVVEKLLCRYIPIIVLTFALIGLLTQIFLYATFEYRMNHDEFHVLAGECEIVEKKESWYRDEFLGYDITIKIEDQIIKPSNTFSENQIDLFQSHDDMTIYYGFMGNELFIYSIYE